MIIDDDNKIVEATEDELYAEYLRRGWDDLMPFAMFKYACEQEGTKIVEPIDKDDEVC